MTWPTRNHIEGEARYVGSEEFLKAFTEDLTGLYQLSFLLAGDRREGRAMLACWNRGRG